MSGPGGSPILAGTGLEFRFIIIITLTACVFINLWIADMISSRGIGNGISMIIFAGIIFFVFSKLAVSFQNTVSVMNLMDGTVKLIFMLLILFASGAFSLFMERGKYNLKVKLQNNSNVAMPFKYNVSGIILNLLSTSSMAPGHIL